MCQKNGLELNVNKTILENCARNKEQRMRVNQWYELARSARLQGIEKPWCWAPSSIKKCLISLSTGAQKKARSKTEFGISWKVLGIEIGVVQSTAQQCKMQDASDRRWYRYADAKTGAKERGLSFTVNKRISDCMRHSQAQHVEPTFNAQQLSHAVPIESDSRFPTNLRCHLGRLCLPRNHRKHDAL